MNDTTKNYNEIVQRIEERNLSAEALLNIITDYTGLQMLDDDFMEHFREEA